MEQKQKSTEKEDKDIVLCLYEYSGVFTNLFRSRGYKVIQVDKQLDRSDVRLMKKIQGNVVGIIAHPPCTHFAASGARWWKDKDDRHIISGLSMVDAVLRMVHLYKPKFWFIENPVGRLVDYLGEPTFAFDPCDFGDPWTKRTCLWGEFVIPKKTPVEPEFVTLSNGKKISKFYYDVTRSNKKKDVANARSRTPLGFAKAFVEANCRKYLSFGRVL